VSGLLYNLIEGRAHYKFVEARMRFSLLLSLVALTTACESDYGINSDPGQNLGDEDNENGQGNNGSGTPGLDSGDFDTAIDEPNGPVAQCEVSPNPVEPPFESATWDGSASYDSNGGSIVSYDWRLISYPTGSSVTNMPPGNGPTRPNFTPDLAGEYIGELTVTNDAGVSDTCEVILESIPAENLWIEMYWAQNNDDMDLHLLAPGGQLETNQDCYYANCVGGLQWGQAGPADNPSLDLDDISGTGPENINIAEPEAGVYTVVVHDYSYSTPDFQGSNDVTVNVYINGSLEWSDTRGISGDGSYTYFAEIDWTTGTVTGM